MSLPRRFAPRNDISFIILFWIFLANAIFSFGQADKGQTTVGAEGEILIKYHTLEKIPPDRIIAQGGAELRYRGLVLFADCIELDTKTKDVVATGSRSNPVSLHLPEEVISSEWMGFNLDSAQGKIEKAFGLLQPSIRYQAEELERKTDNLYSFGHSEFTDCSQPTPRWKFSCARANFKKGDYIEMWGAVFSIKKIPVFYWPYMRYPLGGGRATGFLMPRVGYSGVKGFSYAQAFYWAIARNMDATIAADYYGSKGVGGGLEWRYLFGGGTNGALTMYYFRFKINEAAGGGGASTTPSTPSDAYIIRWNHNQTLPGGFSLTASVDYQSNFDFLREFDNNFQRAVVSNRSSQIYVSKTWPLFNLNVRAAQFETDFPGISGLAGNSIITRYLPQISFDSFKMKLVGPVYFSFASGFTRWQYGWQTDFDAGREMRLQSFNLAPVVSVPWAGIPWLSSNVTVSGNFNYYWRSYQMQPSGARAIADVPLFAYNGVLNIELIGPVIYRIFYLKSGAGIKHIIEPTISYRYESPVVNQDRIITPYSLYLYHQVSYGITNHVLFKQEDLPREVFTWGLSQTFYIAPELCPQSLYRVEGKIPRFSEVSSYLRFYPGTKYSIDFTAGWNPYYKMWSSLRLGANLGLPTDDVFLNVSWYKSINAWYKGAAEERGIKGYTYIWDRHQISLFGGLKLPALGVETQGEIDFNIIEQKMLYSALSLVYHYQCLDLRADVRIFYFREKPELQFKFSIGLGNIGKTTDVLGGMGF